VSDRATSVRMPLHRVARHIAVLGAVVAAVLTESRPRVAEAEPAEDAVFAEAA
jgi:hypothetical protein